MTPKPLVEIHRQSQYNLLTLPYKQLSEQLQLAIQLYNQLLQVDTVAIVQNFDKENFNCRKEHAQNLVEQNYCDKSIISYIGETLKEKGSYVGKILTNRLSFIKFIMVDFSTVNYLHQRAFLTSFQNEILNGGVLNIKRSQSSYIATYCTLACHIKIGPPLKLVQPDRFLQKCLPKLVLQTMFAAKIGVARQILAAKTIIIININQQRPKGLYIINYLITITSY